MNERIRELAMQAGFEFWQDEPWNPGDLIDWSARYDDEFIKFAELIVRECAKISERTGALNEAGFEGEMIADAIKEHFGVEE